MIPRSQVFRFVIALLVAICVSFVLLRQIETGHIPETIRRISPSALLVGFVLYCIFILAKTIRFRQLLAIDRPIFKLLPIFALHTFWGNILPFRSGDLSYIFLMKSREKVTGTKSLASLMLAKIRFGGTLIHWASCRTNVVWDWHAWPDGISTFCPEGIDSFN